MCGQNASRVKLGTDAKKVARDVVENGHNSRESRAEPEQRISRQQDAFFEPGKYIFKGFNEPFVQGDDMVPSKDEEGVLYLNTLS